MTLEAFLFEDVHGAQPVFEQITWDYSTSTNGVELLSVMLQKAWPPQLKEASEQHLEDKQQDEILLNHLLTWITWPAFLKFFGKTDFQYANFISLFGKP